LAATVIGVVIAAALAVHDYNNSEPECVDILDRGGVGAGCPDSDVRWLLVVAVGLGIALVLGAFLEITARAKDNANR
jgi:hypothetical protein